ncbi:MAG: methyltransferase [Chloroflexaceae bacterium]|nr:methyltransferase [Chloroflexaceae bacterium]
MVIFSFEGIQPNVAIMQLTVSHLVMQSLYVVAKLNIADLLVEGPKSCEQLADESGAHAPSLYRMLSVLASMHIFTEDEQGQFSLTPLASTLCTDAPESMRDWVLYSGASWRLNLLNAMVHTIRTGENGYHHLYQQDLYDYFGSDPERNQIFNDGVRSQLISTHNSIVNAYDFSGVNLVVDLGGGIGSLMVKLLQANPNIRGTLYDYPHVAEEAKQFIASSDVADRCEVVSGDVFQSIPPGGDVYIFSWVFAGYNDEQAAQALRVCRETMPAQSRLLIADLVMTSRNQPALSKLLDLMMLTETPRWCPFRNSISRCTE